MKKIVLAMLFAAGGLWAVDLPDPVIWFTMDAVTNGVLKDMSGNGHDVTLGAGLSLGASRVKGKALVSDGTRNTYGTFSAPALDSRTATFWLYRNEKDNDDSITSAENKFPYVFNNVSGLQVMFEGTQDKMRIGVGDCISFAPMAARKRWTHYAVVVEDTGEPSPTTGFMLYNLRVYRDGMEVLSTNGLSATWNTHVESANAILFNNSRGSTRPVWGQLDELRIFDTALTVEQVCAEMRRPLDERGPELIGYWPLDTVDTDGDGVRTVRDETGLSNTLLLGTGLTQVDAPNGKGLYFDGMNTSWSQVTPACNFQALLDTTITMWINIPVAAENLLSISGSNNNRFPQIFSFPGSSSRAELQQARTQNNLRMFWHCGDTAFWLDPALGARETWHHLAFVHRYRYDATAGKWRQWTDAYINGVRSAHSAEMDVTMMLEDPLQPVYFGNASKDAWRSIMGSLHDIAVWSGALDDQAIRDIAQGPASVDVGDDFSVTTGTAELHAELGDGEGTVEWTQVDGPAATINAPWCATPRVALPETGTYTFRATVRGRLRSKSDDVTVTRIAPQSGNVAPTVTLAAMASVTLPQQLNLAATVSDGDGGPGALRVRWTRVSGPGGVWFEPENAVTTRVTFAEAGTYVLACTASDGADDTTATTTVTVAADAVADGLLNGLIMSVTGDEGSPKVEGVSGNICVANADYATTFYAPGRVGVGFKSVGATAFFDTGMKMPEVKDPNASNTWPQDQYRTVSAWVYHDTSSTNRVKQPIIVGTPYTFMITYNCRCVDGSGNGAIFVVQQGFSNGTATSPSWNTQQYAPPAVSGEDRWMHVCVVLDRKYGNHAVYVDGVACAKTSGSPVGGRVPWENLRIGGYPVLDQNVNATPSGYFMDSNGDLYSRTFPGIVDEVRIWNRALSAAEVKRLADDPYVFANRRPQVAVRAAGVATKNRPLAVTGEVHDDGMPAGSSLAYEWEVVSGDASAVTFADRNAASTTATFTAIGTYTLRLKVTDGARTTYGEPVVCEIVQSGTMIILK